MTAEEIKCCLCKDENLSIYSIPSDDQNSSFAFAVECRPTGGLSGLCKLCLLKEEKTRSDIEKAKRSQNELLEIFKNLEGETNLKLIDLKGKLM